MKGKKLVVEHLGGISARVLQEYPKAIQELIRRQSGLYALYRGNRLYYVGLASNLMARLKEHLADRHNGTWDRFGVYLTVHDEHMKELESLLLRIATPRGNKQGGRCMGSRNLRSMRIPDDREHRFQSNVNTDSGHVEQRFQDGEHGFRGT